MAQASAKKLGYTGPAKKERVVSVPQREQLASTPEPLLPKGKGTEPSVQSIDRKEGIVREVKRAAAAEERERYEYSSADEQ